MRENKKILVFALTSKLKKIREIERERKKKRKRERKSPRNIPKNFEDKKGGKEKGMGKIEEKKQKGRAGKNKILESGLSFELKKL